MDYLFSIAGAMLLYFVLPFLPLELTKKARLLVVLNTLLLTMLYVTVANVTTIWLAIVAIAVLLPLTSYIFFTRVILFNEPVMDDSNSFANEEKSPKKVEENSSEITDFDSYDEKEEEQEVQVLEDAAAEIVDDLGNSEPGQEELTILETLDVLDTIQEDEEQVVEEIEVQLEAIESPLELDNDLEVIMRNRKISENQVEVVDLTEEDSGDTDELLQYREGLFAELEADHDKEDENSLETDLLSPIEETSAKNVVETESDLEDDVDLSGDAIDLEALVLQDESEEDLLDNFVIDELEELEEIEELVIEEKPDYDQVNDKETIGNEQSELHATPIDLDDVEESTEDERKQPEMKAKRIDNQILSVVLDELKWIKYELGEEAYEKTLNENLCNKLHPRDYYVFATMLRDLYISQQNHAKLRNLMLDLRERYSHQEVLLEEINYYLNER